MKKIISGIMAGIFGVFFLVGTVFARPFLCSDPIIGADRFDIVFESIIDPATGSSLIFTTPAEPDGSLKLDLSQWDVSQYGFGWFDGKAYTVSTWECLDEVTQLETTCESKSNPALFKLKVPNTKSAGNMQLKN